MAESTSSNLAFKCGNILSGGRIPKWLAGKMGNFFKKPGYSLEESIYIALNEFGGRKPEKYSPDGLMGDQEFAIGMWEWLRRNGMSRCNASSPERAADFELLVGEFLRCVAVWSPDGPAKLI